MEQFPSFASAYRGKHAQKILPNAWAKSSFEQSKLDLSERLTHADTYNLHYDLLKIRREDPTISKQDRFAVDGAVLDALVFVIRYFGDQGNDRLLLINFGGDFDYTPIPEPLLAPSKKGGGVSCGQATTQAMEARALCIQIEKIVGSFLGKALAPKDH